VLLWEREILLQPRENAMIASLVTCVYSIV